jgi:hypothetical protein
VWHRGTCASPSSARWYASSPSMSPPWNARHMRCCTSRDVSSCWSASSESSARAVSHRSDHLPARGRPLRPHRELGVVFVVAKLPPSDQQLHSQDLSSRPRSLPESLCPRCPSRTSWRTQHGVMVLNSTPPSCRPPPAPLHTSHGHAWLPPLLPVQPLISALGHVPNYCL